MNLMSRRDASKILLAGSAGLLATTPNSWGAQYINSVIRGVQLGAQSYSFRDLKLDACIEAFKTIGLGECELCDNQFYPDLTGEKLKQWLSSPPPAYLHDIRTKFDNAGVKIYALTIGFRRDHTDQEIESRFRMTKEMGVKYITSSSNVSVARRVDQYAQKYKIMVGFHGHDQTSDPDEFSSADSFARAMEGASRYIGVNLDVGHFVAAGGDPIAYIRQHHERIVAVHLKDRKKNHGANLPFGQGDTPIVEVLHLLRDNKWRIPANIEYEYGNKHMDTVAEVKKCYDYCRRALES